MNPRISLRILPEGKAQPVDPNAIPDAKSVFIWHHFFCPSEEELKLLDESFGLHHLAIEDCLDDDQIPKMESFPLNSHVLFNTFHNHDGDWLAEEVNIFIGANFLVTATRSESLDAAMTKISNRMTTAETGAWKNGPAWLMHSILDKIIDEKMLALETLEDEMDDLEDSMLGNDGNFDFTKLQQLRRAFLLLRKSLFHEREILNRIIRRDCEFINDNSVYIYRDVFDHVVRLYELAESCRENIKNLVELHLAMANNQIAMTGNLTNKTVRRLTFITTIFMPLTLIAGIGGMSEYSMMTGPENWRMAYILLIGILTLLGVLSYIWLRRMDND